MGCRECPGETEEGVRHGGHVCGFVFPFSLEVRGEKVGQKNCRATESAWSEMDG